MKKSKIINALSFLKKDEWISFQKYILMYSSDSSDQYKLLDILSKKKSKLDQLPNKDIFRQSYFPAMSSKSFLNLSSRVFQIFEEWFVWQEMKKDIDKRDAILVKCYNRRGMYELADKKYKAITKNLNGKKKLTFDTSSNLNYIYHYHHFSENKAKRVIGGRLLDDAVSNFNKSYKERALLYLIEMANVGIGIKFDFTKQIELIKKSIADLPDSEVSLLLQNLYNSKLNGTSKPLEAVYNLLSNDKIKNGSDIETLVNLYSINISTNNWLTGTSDNKQIIIDFYNLALESGILLNLGKISCHRFVNIISVLIHTQSVLECNQFIDKWCHLIGDEDLESAKNLSYVYPKIKAKQYEDIIYLLRGKKFNSIYMELRAIAFENMALYKTEEWDILKNRLQNHKRKIRGAKNKITKYLYDAQLSYIAIIEILSKSYFTKVKPIDLNNYPAVFHRSWVEEEIKSRGLNQHSAY